MQARDDLRSFSSNDLQRRCGLQPLSSVRVTFNQWSGRYQRDLTIACKLAHSCPCCSTRKLAITRSKVLEEGNVHLSLGGSFVCAVLTLPKRNAQDLAYAHTILRNQCARFRRRMRIVEAEYQLTTSFRILEETYSEVTHWHPHANFIWLWPPGSRLQNTRAFLARIVEEWLRAAKTAIRGVSEKAQKAYEVIGFRDWKNTVAYFLKHSYFPMQAPSPDKSGQYLHLSPWEILQLARQGNKHWQHLWRQFEQDVKHTVRVKRF